MAPHSTEANDSTKHTELNGSVLRSSESDDSTKHAGSADAAMGGSKLKPLRFPQPPTFDDPLVERDYLKGRLAAAFRIFGKYGFDEGVAGHITIRVGLCHGPAICFSSDHIRILSTRTRSG